MTLPLPAHAENFPEISLPGYKTDGAGGNFCGSDTICR